jgi:hypothetical protein
LNSYTILGIDYRSLSLFRQVIALIYINLVFVVRVLYFDCYSIENGPFTNEVFKSIQNAPFLVSLLQTDRQLILYLCLALLPGITLFLGVFPSFSAFGAMFFYILLARRFFPYYYGVDEVLVSLLFVMSLFYFFSNLTDKKIITIKENPFLLLLLVQIVLIYWLNGLNKTHISWWKGEAVNMVLFNVLFNKPLGIEFLQYENLNKILTYGTLLFEITFPLWIFSGYKPKWFRIIGGLSILCFHWGINLFVDVSFYKYFGIAFFFLLMPDIFWNKFPLLAKLAIHNFGFNKVFNLKINVNIIRKMAFLITFFIVFKAIGASVLRQEKKYEFIPSKNITEFLNRINSRNLSPFKQGWTMFAPSLPQDAGYIAFEYVDEFGRLNNINIYGNEMPKKKFSYYHPINLCLIAQYNAIAKGHLSKEAEFVIFNLFDFEVNQNRTQHPERQQADYELALYQQTYLDFKKSNAYNFNRYIIAAYD